MSKQAVVPRKQPTQERSKKKVASIFEAAVTLMEKGGIEEVTALKIAKEAGITVASVYQYFPNRNAIIYSLYQRWLEEVSRIIDRVEEEAYLKLSVVEFFKEIDHRLSADSSFSEKAVAELFRAMEVYPHLQELENLHSQNIVDRLAEYLKGYGSQWSLSRLKNLGWYIYITANSIMRGSLERDAEARGQFNEWNETVLEALLEKCLEG